MTNLTALLAATIAAESAAKAAADNAKLQRQALLDALQAAGERTYKVPGIGSATVCKGKRTVRPSKALAAQITAMKEAGVIDGTASESVGADYVTVKPA